jgi:hypothetical protein
VLEVISSIVGERDEHVTLRLRLLTASTVVVVIEETRVVSDSRGLGLDLTARKEVAETRGNKVTETPVNNSHGRGYTRE